MNSFVKRASAGIRAEMSSQTKTALPDDTNWRNAKYEILNEEKHSVMIGDTRYQRIRALRRIERPFGLPPVEPGDLGGYVAMGTVPYGDCLSNEGDCWIADEAFVSGYVSGDSQVTGHAHVSYPSEVSGQSLISDYAQVIDGAEVSDSMVTDYAQVVGRNLWGLGFEPLLLKTSGEILGEQTQVDNHSWISGRARVSDGAYVGRFSSVKGSTVVAGRIFLTSGSSISGVVLVSECDPVIIRGEFIDEPMNMWGYPKGIVIREGDGNFSTLQALGDTDRGSVLPYFGVDYWRHYKTPREIAEIYGIELEFHDTGNGTWASSFDKHGEVPRKIHVSPATGIEYFEPASKEELEEYMDKVNKEAEAKREAIKEERGARDRAQWEARAAWRIKEEEAWYAEHPEEK
jgi:hypothetical protein